MCYLSARCLDEEMSLSLASQVSALKMHILPGSALCPGFAALIWVSVGLLGILTTEELDVLLKGYMLCAGKTDSHRSKEEGTSRNAKPGEFAAADPKKPENNTPENAREKGGQ